MVMEKQKLTKNLTPKSKSYALTAVAKDQPEKEAIEYFKEVCLRDGLEMRSELIKLIKDDWVKRHPKPGNPQLMLSQCSKKKLKSLCMFKDCSCVAVWKCFSVFPFGKDRRLCDRHRVNAERLGELRGKQKI